MLTCASFLQQVLRMQADYIVQPHPVLALDQLTSCFSYLLLCNTQLTPWPQITMLYYFWWFLCWLGGFFACFAWLCSWAVFSWRAGWAERPKMASFIHLPVDAGCCQGVSLSQSTSPPCQGFPASEIDFLSGRLSTVLLEATVEVTKSLKDWLLSHITPLFYILFVKASPRPAQIQRIKEVDTLSWWRKWRNHNTTELKYHDEKNLWSYFAIYPTDFLVFHFMSNISSLSPLLQRTYLKLSEWFHWRNFLILDLRAGKTRCRRMHWTVHSEEIFLINVVLTSLCPYSFIPSAG